ncbi:alpha/beta hydrolase [Luteibacter aegosomaticola]|uniref:alpha/beta fold hydrolase n=1 Tax=Luteibacter aegosomaticola TaxID=2911538 RepID=UPI001FF90DCC|nr:alpha/beta hydrolase [Luteibacter aegosomaticola]UPG92114.1 alpha/beta hydrolase [Luteibacter aegosomaticola]
MNTQAKPPVVFYRNEKIDGLNIAYREAGPADAPVVLLLHGFPTSSHMFRNLIPYLATRYRVIAPDYPGYGESDAPDVKDYHYSFEGFGNIVRTLLERLKVQKYAMYVMDYGAPVGWQLFLKNPEKLTALIIQNGNAYDEGLKAFWDPIKVYWADGAAKSRDALRWLVKLDTTIFQYTDGVDDKTRISPDNWVHDQRLLDRPGNEDVQMDVMYDYRKNVPLYPEVQRLFREHQPPTLITWGERDTIFPADGAHPYKRDLKDLEFHLFPTGHFALEDKGDEIMPLIGDFLDRKLGKKA